MQFRQAGVRTLGCIALLGWAVLTGQLFAQEGSGTLRGQVTDPSGALVPHATVSATATAGQPATAATNRQGVYEIKGLAPGSYTVSAVAKGFAVYEQRNVAIAASQTQHLDIALEIAVQEQNVEVKDQGTNVDVDPASNAGAIVIKGKDLDALSDDPDELQADLLALAGPSAGPNGGQIYIDGFSNGQLPPKSAIREVRINTNPFSAEFDHIGFGRVEVFTKPGQDKFRGQFMTFVNNSTFNSRNPFGPAGQLPGYHSEMYSGNFSGPINQKASFFFNAERRNVNDSSIVNATILDSNFNRASERLAVLHPQTRVSISPRLDYQITKDNTLTARYHFTRASGTNDDIGGYLLPSQASNSRSTEHEVQLSDTQVISTSTINETRFEYSRNWSARSVLNFQPTISVAEAFTDGGNSKGRNADHRDDIELQNLTMQSRGAHSLKFGGRLRAGRDATEANSGYNGTFSFPSIDAYQRVRQGMAQGLTPAQIRATCAAALGPNPVRTALLDCGANQFSITTGIPAATVSQVDLGIYASDDWKIRPNITLSYGLRFETQNNIGDHADIAPRLAIAWGIGGGKSAPKTVLRAGFGMFYDRFSQNLVLRAEQLDGIHQQRFVIGPTSANPLAYPDFFPAIPDLSTLLAFAQSQAIYRIDPNLRAPYIMQAAVSMERQLTKTATLAMTYISSRGLHQLVTNNVNAPLNGVLPDPTAGPIYQYQTEGIFKQQQLMIVPNIRISSVVSLHSFYSLSYANGTPGTPSNPYNLMMDYGRAGFDVRHRFFAMGSISLPYGFRLNPNIMASSGRPFNITIGQDLNGDSFFNDRPSFANPNNSDPQYLAGVRSTRWGTFNIAPLPGEKIIPINYGTGPGQFTMGLRLSKTFALGKRPEIASREGSSDGQGADRAGGRGHGGVGGGGRGGDHGPGGGGGGHGPGGGIRVGFGGGMGPGGPGGGSNGRYSLTIAADARNLFNNVNPASPIGNLSAGSNFGKFNALAGGGPSTSANRRISFLAVFSF